MEKQEFKISIDASRNKVWDTLIGEESFRKWTSAFAEGSHAKTDWKKGSKALFLDSKNEGMVSTIAENIPNEFLSIKHLGIVKNGVEDLDSAETREWAGSLENYTLKTVNGKTELTIDMDVTEEHKDYFKNTWPKALDKLKKLAEESN
jgi:Activator of Hsp90 ATPase homolog 1-like protein